MPDLAEALVALAEESARAERHLADRAAAGQAGGPDRHHRQNEASASTTNSDHYCKENQ